ncbi:MAG: lipopolysaccharide heptosyltransferase II [Desulfobulbaceae bacterium]
MASLPQGLRKILIRSTNWIGDAIMTTPAVRTIRRNFPEAEITLLALPWVADVFRASPRVDRILSYERAGRHAGLWGKFTLAAELRRERFDGAILLQNAFEAAFITLLAGIPVRAGYTTDGRGLLLTHGVRRTAEIKKLHQVHYYQEMVRGLGCVPGDDDLELVVPGEGDAWAKDFLREANLAGRKIIGLNPGASYGPAKRWPAEKFAALARELHRSPDSFLLLFGTSADRQAADEIKGACPDKGRVMDLTGRTTLAQAMGLISCCHVFVTNDSGLMHVAAALATPTVAIFGSTNPVTTGPFSVNSSVVRSDLACSPCLETHCPNKHFHCMETIGVDDVLHGVQHYLTRANS